MNNIRAANVRANMECNFEASLYRENEILYFTYACQQIFTCVAPIASARVQALLATSILFNARKSVGGGSVFSLSFRSFLSLFIRNKRERKGHFKKLFISK